MDDGGILFDEATWRTHILTAPAAVVYEALVEHGGGGPVALAEARNLLRDALGLDPDAPEMGRLLGSLTSLGVIRG